VLITDVIAEGTSLKCLMSMTTKVLKISNKTLWKHKKFMVQINEDDGLGCWAIICRHPYKNRLPNNVKAKVQEFWHLNAHVYSNAKDAMRHHISRGEYVIHASILILDLDILYTLRKYAHTKIICIFFSTPFKDINHISL